jgi:hypothetical protein
VNVYTRATFGGTAVTLVLLAAVIALDVLLMAKVPLLRHGFGYGVLFVTSIAFLLKLLRLIFDRGRRPEGD